MYHGSSYSKFSRSTSVLGNVEITFLKSRYYVFIDSRVSTFVNRSSITIDVDLFC